MVQKTRKSIAEQAAVVILAGGSGLRMGQPNVAKVCFEIDGEPAINRTIGTFKKLGFRQFMVVVGSMTEQVLATVCKAHPEVTFVYQSRQLGTGHAAKVAAQSLKAMGHHGEILLTLGDKFLEQVVIEALVAGYIRQQADAAILTIPKVKITAAASGRVFIDSTGQVVGIIERTDIKRQAIVDELKKMMSKGKDITGSVIENVCSKHLSNPRKLAIAAGELLKLAKSGGKVNAGKLAKLLDAQKYNLTIAGKRYTARQIERACGTVNPSLYLFDAEAFYMGVGMIDNDNAQGEYYFTDTVKHLGGMRDKSGRLRYRVCAVAVDNPDWIQGFNSPDELLRIQDYVRRRKITAAKAAAVSVRPRLSKSKYRSVSEWMSEIEAGGTRLKRWLRNIYGPEPGLHAEKCRLLLRVLRCYGRRFGFDEKVVIVRAPGRINLMGRHVDHRGGFNNFLAINRETLAVAALREDDRVVAINTEPRKFKSVRFSISELMGGFAWGDWINFVNSEWVRSLLRSAEGNWGNYLKAATLRLQHQYQDLKIHGANIALSGNVPIGAGLSSSSTLVVATLQAAIALNNLELTSQQFIDLCGEGEWFVGSREASGNHAAIYLGQRGRIAHVGYLPFRIERIIDSPQNYQIILADSHIKTKSDVAKQIHNARIAGYELGLALLKQRCPQVAGSIEYVRDIDADRLGCSRSEIYRLLLKVPEFMTRKDFRDMLSSEYRELLERNFATHAEPKCYGVRGVLLFGAAEIMRSRLCIEYLDAGRIDEFGELMKVSHNGDRVARLAAAGRYEPVETGCSDGYLNRLIADLASEDPRRVQSAQLYMQPGRYGCSTKEIDRMVDMACSVPGVVGAQMAGGGLGGCIMILAKTGAVEAVRKVLTRQYYTPNNLKPAMIACRTVEGAGLVAF